MSLRIARGPLSFRFFLALVLRFSAWLCADADGNHMGPFMVDVEPYPMKCCGCGARLRGGGWVPSTWRDLYRGDFPEAWANGAAARAGVSPLTELPGGPGAGSTCGVARGRSFLSRASSRPDQRRFRDQIVSGSQFRQTTKLEEVESIMRQHDNGVFSRSAPYCEETIVDDRINAVVGTRIGAQLAADFDMKAANEEEAAVSLAKSCGKFWPAICGNPIASALHFWGLYLGVAVAEIAWGGSPRRWVPRLVPYHPTHVRWDWNYRRFALTTVDGVVLLPRPDEEPNGDGRWFVYCPFGVQYGWRRGLIRPTALKYLSRTWSERDWDRYNELRSMGIIKALVPPNQGNETQRQNEDAFFDDIDNMGSEPVVQCPQGATKDTPGYDVKIEEFSSRNWEGLKERKADLNTDISVLWLGQNLTTEGGNDGGSRALGEVQNLVRIDKALEDAAFGPEVGRQVLVPMAIYNGDDPENVPIPTYDVAPPEDELGEAQTIKTIAEALALLVTVDPQIDIATMLQEYGLPRLSDEEFAALLGEGEDGAPGKAAGGGVQITPSAQSAIIKVNEARALIGLGPLVTDTGATDPDGALTVAEFQAKHSETVAAAVNAEGGSLDGSKPAPAPSPFGARPPAPAAAGEGDAIEPGPADPAAKKPPATAKARALLMAAPAGVNRRLTFAGLPVAIENPRGTIRMWTGPDGHAGATKMELDYGFIEGTFSGDREPLDCYLGPDEGAQHVFVIHQKKAPDFRGHDEDKVMLGFPSADSAMAGYLMHRSDGGRSFDSMTMFTLDAFKRKLRMRRAESTGKIRARAEVLERALVAMTGRADGMTKLARNITAQARSARFQDTLIKTATAKAAKVMAPYLQSLGGEVARATSLHEIRKQLLRRFEAGSPTARRLAKIVANSSVMSGLAGTDDALTEVE